ncbi:MAG TPA: glycosyltransferase family 4 protein [Bradyrhizobium sp.]|jgi:glycosyltransferase involved in cell wall biosynthesis
MRELGKILVVSQHYPPDPTTTATYIGEIARALAADRRVVVLSGSPNSAASANANPEVIEIADAAAPKDALARRAIAISWLAIRMFVATLRRAERRDAVFCVTTPFTLPYGVMLAARLRGAATVLLIYDLYPEALQAAGLAKPSSLMARLIRRANAALFRRLDAIIIIGRDVAPLLLAYGGVAREKIHFIPNWTLLPAAYRAVATDNRFRVGRQKQLIVGLSGNLGFTHDPRTVFAAARLLRANVDIHFLLSGWGVGWNELNDLQAKEQLGNLTLLPPVPHDDLIDFLSAADIWVIPYRRNIAGVSIPSRLYNLLAIGRAVIVAAESNTEAALVIGEEQIGWVVPPEKPAALAESIARAAENRADVVDKGRRAAAAAEKYSPQLALARYREVILQAGSRDLRS